MTRPLALMAGRTVRRTPGPATRDATIASELLAAAAVPASMLLALLAVSAPLVAASALAATALAVYAARQALQVAPTARRRQAADEGTA